MEVYIYIYKDIPTEKLKVGKTSSVVLHLFNFHSNIFHMPSFMVWCLWKKLQMVYPFVKLEGCSFNIY